MINRIKHYLWFHWQNIGLLALCVMVFYWIFSLGLKTGMDKMASFRYTDIHYGLAISHMVPGYPKDYTALDTITYHYARKFIGVWTLQEIVRKAELDYKEKRAGKLFFRGEDKGTADFVRFAFQLFGFKVQSLYYMFFVALGFPMVVFIFCYYQKPGFLVFLLFFLLALYSVSFFLGHFESTNLNGIHDPRFLSILSVVALSHILLVMYQSDTKTFKPLHIIAVFLQACAMIFAVHFRSDSAWQIVCIFFSIPVFYFLLRSKVKKPKTLIFNLLWPVCIMLIVVFSHKAYLKLTLHPQYFSEDTTGHIFWKAAVVGFSEQPDLRRKYQVINGDDALYKMVERDYEAPCRNEVCHEKKFKDIFFRIVGLYPQKVLEAYVNKPALFIKEVKKVLKDPNLNEKGLNYNPFRWEILLVLAVTVLFVNEFYLFLAVKLMIIASLILVFSFLPSMFVGPAFHIAAICFVTIPLFIYVVLIFLIVAPISMLSGRM